MQRVEVIFRYLRGGPSYFFGRTHFEHRAPQDVPLVIIGETFVQGSGPRPPTGSEPRPAQLLRPKVGTKLFL